MATELLHLSHSDAVSARLENHVKLTVGCFGVVNQPNPHEIGVIELEGAWKIGSAHPVHGHDNSCRVSRHHHLTCTSERKGATCCDS